MSFAHDDPGHVYTIIRLDGSTVRSTILPPAYEICQQTGVVHEHKMTNVIPAPKRKP